MGNAEGPVGKLCGVQRVPKTEDERGKRYPPDMTITMAIPCKDLIPGIPGISRETMVQFEKMAETTAKAGYSVHIIPPELTKSSNTPVTRWRIVERMKGDWLLMMDADAFPMPDTLNKLLLAAKEDPDDLKKIIGVPSVRPQYPHWPHFANLLDGIMIPLRYGVDYGDDEVDATESCVHEVDGNGFHCVLIHRSVFEVIPHPWFELNVPDEETGVIYGHDYRFCRRAKMLGGIKTYVDFSCRVGHYGLKAFTLADTRAILQSSPAEMVRQDDLLVHPEANLDGDDTEHLANFFAKKKAEKDQMPDVIIPKGAME